MVFIIPSFCPSPLRPRCVLGPSCLNRLGCVVGWYDVGVAGDEGNTMWTHVGRGDAYGAAEQLHGEL